MKPILLKNKILIKTFIKTTIDETLNGVIVLSLAKKEIGKYF